MRLFLDILLAAAVLAWTIANVRDFLDRGAG
jgi:hypothetical protein